jgi:hypothetical protein
VFVDNILLGTAASAFVPHTFVVPETLLKEKVLLQVQITAALGAYVLLVG